MKKSNSSRYAAINYKPQFGSEITNEVISQTEIRGKEAKFTRKHYSFQSVPIVALDIRTCLNLRFEHILCNLSVAQFIRLWITIIRMPMARSLMYFRKFSFSDCHSLCYKVVTFFTIVKASEGLRTTEKTIIRRKANWGFHCNISAVLNRRKAVSSKFDICSRILFHFL